KRCEKDARGEQARAFANLHWLLPERRREQYTPPGANRSRMTSPSPSAAAYWAIAEESECLSVRGRWAGRELRSVLRDANGGFSALSATGEQGLRIAEFAMFTHLLRRHPAAFVRALLAWIVLFALAAPAAARCPI